MMMGIDEFLNSLGQHQEKQHDRWQDIIRRPSPTFAPCVLILGDVGSGKSGLSYYLLERFSREYALTPVVVGLPRDKAYLLPSDFEIASIEEIKDKPNAIIFIDEADLQLPFNDAKMVKTVINFLNLPRQRQQILLFSFHYPRLVRGTYLPSFSAFLLKRPPYLLEFAGKSDSKELVNMMSRAEERFAELPEEDVVKNTYVIAPRLRWQGLVQNPLPSFWSEDLSRVWSGVENKQQLGLELPKVNIKKGEHPMVEGFFAEDYEPPKSRIGRYWEFYHHPEASPAAEHIAKQVSDYLASTPNYTLNPTQDLEKHSFAVTKLGECPWARSKDCPCRQQLDYGECKRKLILKAG